MRKIIIFAVTEREERSEKHGGWNGFSHFSLRNRSSLGRLCNRIIGLRSESMTWGDLYKKFCKKFPKSKAIDYRPFVEWYLPTHRPGIIVWLENVDVLVYIPKPEKEQRL